MPRDNRLFTLFLTIAVCLHIVRLHIRMLWLTKIMQKPAVARRALAVELLRRLDRTESRRHRSQCLPTSRPRFAEEKRECQQHRSIVVRPPQSYRTNLSITDLQARLPQQSVLGAAMDGLAFEQLAMNDSSNVSTPTESQTFTPEVVQPLERLVEHDHGATSECVDLTPPASPKVIVRPVETDILSSLGLSCTPPPSDCGVSDLDTTSLKRNGSPSPQVRTPIDLEDDTLGGADEVYLESSDRSLVNDTDVLYGPATPQYHRRQRNFSVESTPTTIRRSGTRTLRAPSKNNGGLFELRASASKTKDPPAIRAHRRRMSVDLLRPIASQPAEPHLQPPSPVNLSIPVQAALEVQYKYRHIFIGTASLYTFLKTLPTTLGSTTRLSVMQAFTALAAQEQLLCRQRSTSSEDWSLVSRTTTAISDFNYIALAHVQLGAVSLRQFVDSIPFDECDRASTVAVVDAFKNASLVDSGEDGDVEGRAGAFRSWLLSQHGVVG